MGSIAGRKLWNVLANVERVLSIEILCACQGIDLLRPLVSSSTLERIVGLVRTVVPFAEADRVLYHDMDAVHKLVVQGAIIQAIPTGMME
jgi:histidine ammonia-lyase